MNDNAPVLTAREERVLRITLNRPEKRNAINSAMCRAVIEAVEAAEEDPGIGAILIESTGSMFCAGMDLDEATAPDAAEQTAIHERLFTLGARIRKPIVAAVQGTALGGGVGLIANAHVVVAAQGATFGLTEIRIGMWPFVIYRAIRMAFGERRALELSLTGRIFGMNEAVQWGLVHHAVPAFELDDRATAIATGLAASSPNAIRSGLEFVYASREMGVHEAGELAARMRGEIFAGEEFQEGVRALREKRTPRWSSRE